MDGRVLGENLHRMGVDETWLLRQLRQQGYHSAREVFLAVADANKQVAVYPVST
ncbi:MAG: YetF domain-containing protein [Oscillospiraceae bacterium]